MATTATSFIDLPLEIQLGIRSHLTYPDLLALKISNARFFHHKSFKTSKSDRIEWLLQRATARLPIPMKGRVRWATDEEFVANEDVKSILQRRRLHLECRDFGSQCLLVDGQVCRPKRGTWAHPPRYRNVLALVALLVALITARLVYTGAAI